MMFFEKKKNSVGIPQIILSVGTLLSALYVTTVAIAIWKREKLHTKLNIDNSNQKYENKRVEINRVRDLKLSENGKSMSNQSATDKDSYKQELNTRENEDSKFNEAIKLAVEHGKISTSLIQRNLGIGYGRAANIINRMEALGYVSSLNGNKPRELLPAIYAVFSDN